MPITLEDLTKEELLTLCHRWCLTISERDIRMVRHESLIASARNLSAEACKEVEENKGNPLKRREYFAAQEKFDRAMELYDEAGKLLKEK